MRKSLIVILLLITFSVSAQKKDSLQVADTVATITVADMKQVLSALEDKVTKKTFDIIEQAYGLLIQASEDRRQKFKQKKEAKRHDKP